MNPTPPNLIELDAYRPDPQRPDYVAMFFEGLRETLEDLANRPHLLEEG